MVVNKDKIVSYIDYFIYLKGKLYNKRENLLLIAVEGPDKVGKTTLLRRINDFIHNSNDLSKMLENNSYVIVLELKDKVDKLKFNFPVALLYEILSYRNIQTLDILNKLYAVNNMNIEERPFLIVLYDRYLESTLVYQILYFLNNNRLDVQEKDIRSLIDNLFISANYLIPDVTIGLTQSSYKEPNDDEVIEFYNMNAINQIYEIIFERMQESNIPNFIYNQSFLSYSDEEQKNFIKNHIFRIIESDKTST